MEEIRETALPKQGGTRLKKSGKGPLIALGLILAVLAGAYAGLCVYAGSLGTFYPGTTINGVAVGGLTPVEAAGQLQREIPNKKLEFYLPKTDETGDGENASEHETLYEESPAQSVSYEDLGFTSDLDYQSAAQHVFDLAQTEPGFFADGWGLVRSLIGSGGARSVQLEPEESAFGEKIDQLAQEFSREPLDTGYTVTEDGLEITLAQNGLEVGSQALEQSVRSAVNDAMQPQVLVEGKIVPAQTMTAQEIHDEAAGQMKNATYDVETDTILPEQAGAEFDVNTAQTAMDRAAPGETVSVPAEVQLPSVTAKDLEELLFRDVLGEAKTKVGGTSARKSNVRLSAASIHEYVMNPGDVFSYNEVVGQRTAARGYKPAPAYVQGETVDEIGGGICQTSSTLYLACLRSNLEITERYAHRYIPAYIAAGMDATVSWGGPDYKFTNNTDYPIKIVTSYEGSYLTVKILGTNLDGTSVKMTNEFLSSTPYEVIYEDDPTLAPGTEKVKTSPYTGYKYRTYRNVYDADGKLISSEYEATSDYKSRNKVILRGPAVETPENPDTPVLNPGDVSDPSQPGEGSGTESPSTQPGTPSEPGDTGSTGGESTTPTEPSEPENPPLIVVPGL